MISQQKIIIRGNKRSSRSINGGGQYSELIPIDLIIEICSRLPAKSIAIFRCVSKLWASQLRDPYFTELFLTRSSSRPQVLFAFLKGNEVFFFSIPQLQNHDEKLSSVVATYVTKTSFRVSVKSVGHINGLVFLRKDWRLRSLFNDDIGVLSMICSPSTRQSLVVPKLSHMRKCFLGYDPINKQYKLLAMTLKGCKVLTLGFGNLLWRDILCCTNHYHLCNGICINGVLYYRAAVNVFDIMIVCFDIGSEKFHIMIMENFSRAMHVGATLINYNGKLGSIMPVKTYNNINGRSVILEIWVLEDIKKHEWLKHIHLLPPPLWEDLIGGDYLSFVGMIGTEEIMFSQSKYGKDGNFYVMYYNMKKNSVVKVEIKGLEACKSSGRVFTFLNHVENLKLLF